MEKKNANTAKTGEKLPFSKYMVLGDSALVLPILIAYIFLVAYGAKATMRNTVQETSPEAAAVVAYAIEDEVNGDLQAALEEAAACGVLSPETGVKVLDKNGGTVADNGKAACDLTKVSADIAAGENSAKVLKQSGRNYVVAYAPISGSEGLSVVLTFPAYQYGGYFTQLWLVIAAVTVFFILFAAWGIRRSVAFMVGPMTSCVNSLKRMAAGDYTTPVPEVDAHCQELDDIRNATEALRQDTHEVVDDVSYLLGQMATGDLSVMSRVPGRYLGDYAAILEGERRIKAELTQILQEILTISEQVSGGSEQVSNGAQSLAQGATEQASSIEQLSESISRVAEQIQHSAAEAEKANQLTAESGEIMQSSAEAMSQASAAMDEISETSRNIGKVIKAIDDIAFQTNILALNAAVEAARAGSAGKGFAVVADEVRNLSQKSAEAAKNTTALIESSITAVEKGGKLVSNASDDFTQVAEKSAQVSDIVAAICVQFKEQAGETSAIANGIEQVASVVQMNSATSEESAAASEELSSQANVLRGLVGQFTLDESNR